MRMSDWSSDVCSSDLTNRRRSSITEHSFHGIDTSRQACLSGGVTHVSGTMCHLCLGSLIDGGDEVAVAAVPDPGQLGPGDREGGVSGTSGAVRVDLGGRRIIKKKKEERTCCHI